MKLWPLWPLVAALLRSAASATQTPSGGLFVLYLERYTLHLHKDLAPVGIFVLQELWIIGQRSILNSPDRQPTEKGPPPS